MQSYLERVELAIHALKQGKMVILTDNPEREDEGDLIMAAESITPDTMNFIIRNSTGIVCLSMPEAQLKKLQLPLMVAASENSSQRSTPFTIAIDARDNITTGVSAADRVTTIRAAINDDATPDDLVKPGHIYPLQAKAGGVLERPGHTEGSIDLVQLAGFKPAAVLCEVMNPDGTMARGRQLTDFATQHQLVMLSIEDIIAYRLSHENLIAEEVSTDLPIEQYGQFKLTIIKEKITGQEHVILEKKSTMDAPLVRVHSACLTGDLLGSLRCDCHKQLHYSLERIAGEGGLLIYLNQEGRGIGLFNKIKAYALQETGLDTVEANQALGLPVDARQYSIAANILRNREIQQVRLLTNNPEKAADLQRYGIQSVLVESMPAFCNLHNQRYLQIKKDKLNHAIALHSN